MLEHQPPTQAAAHVLAGDVNALEAEGRRLARFESTGHTPGPVSVIEPKLSAEFPHTLNASGVALPRTFAALLENHQTADGRVIIPSALRPYVDGLEELAPEA